MGVREWFAASDPSALGFLGGVLWTCLMVLLFEAANRK